VPLLVDLQCQTGDEAQIFGTLDCQVLTAEGEPCFKRTKAEALVAGRAACAPIQKQYGTCPSRAARFALGKSRAERVAIAES